VIPMNGPEMIGFAAALVVIPIIVAHLKPLLRTIPGVSDAKPWPLVADAIGIGWVYMLREAGHAPAWIDNIFAVVLAGLVLGVLAGLARDGAEVAQQSIAGQSAGSTRPTIPEPE
jgi:hypothetical protein